MKPALAMLGFGLMLTSPTLVAEPLSSKAVRDTPARIIHITEQLANDPGNINLRLELSFACIEIRDETNANRHFAWLLANADRYAAHMEADRPRLDHRILGELLQFVEHLRDEISNLGYARTIQPVDGWQTPDMTLAQQRFVTMFSPAYADEPAPFEATLGITDRARLRPINELIVKLGARRDAGTSTERDLFVLKALTGTNDEVRTLSDSLQEPPASPKASD